MLREYEPAELIAPLDGNSGSGAPVVVETTPDSIIAAADVGPAIVGDQLPVAVELTPVPTGDELARLRHTAHIEQLRQQANLSGPSAIRAAFMYAALGGNFIEDRSREDARRTDPSCNV